MKACSFKIGGAPTVFEFMERYFEEAGLSKEDQELKGLCKYLAKMALYDY